MDPMLDYQAEMLMNKTKHYLITTMGRTADEANIDEFYRALSFTLREEIMINWLSTTRTIANEDVRIVYYLSMEYLPGRLFSNNITNICSTDLVRLVLQKMNRNFSDVISREPDPGLGNGGLGRLASCFLDSLATMHYPAQAYGLRYQYGIFEQQLWDGVQIEAPDLWLANENPWEFRRDMRKAIVKYHGVPKSEVNIHGDEVLSLKDYEEVSALPFDLPIIGYSNDSKFSVVTLRLWTTKESPRNFRLQRYNAGRLDEASENTALTDVLYPSDNTEVGKRIRLKQEFLLVSASLQDIIRHYLTKHDNFRAFPDKVRIQINDTHPATVIPELIRILTKKYDLPWKTAVDMTHACTGYTNHTVLSEALEEWDQGLYYNLLPRQYKVIERLNQDFCSYVRSRYPDDEEKIRRISIIEKGKVRMAPLAIYGSHKVNGVAKIHSEILKNSVFKDFYELYPDKFINITNGVTQRRWLLHCNPELSDYITKKIGNGWITNFNEISKIAEFASDPEAQHILMNIKKRNKQHLIEFIQHENKLKNAYGQISAPSPIIDIDSIFDIQVKRIHEYKRQLMNALHLIMLYHEITENPHSNRHKRTAIFGGKAAAGYETAKDIIRLIHAISRKANHDPAVKGLLRIIYIENYNVSKAEIIIPAADLSEQISTAGTEASGTGNMKFSMNGALTIGTKDGANIEMAEAVKDQWWPFSFGASAEEIALLKNTQTYSPKAICERNAKIGRAVESLRDRSFAQTEEEHVIFTDLYHKLMESHYGGPPDRYFTLYDLESYYNTQIKVEELYRNPEKWTEFVFHNIAGMGDFSTDCSIKNYADLIWGIKPCPINEEILERVRYEYSEHDKCRIF